MIGPCIEAEGFLSPFKHGMNKLQNLFPLVEELGIVFPFTKGSVLLVL